MESRASCGTGLEVVQALPPTAAHPSPWLRSFLPSHFLSRLTVYPSLSFVHTAEGGSGKVRAPAWGAEDFLATTDYIAGAIRSPEVLDRGWADGSKLLRPVGACNMVLLFIKAAIHWKPAVDGQYDNCNGTYFLLGRKVIPLRWQKSKLMEPRFSGWQSCIWVQKGRQIPFT